MPEGRPFVSVIIPTYNCASFLPDAVASIRMQRYEPLEIIVVDDGSTDQTEDVARALEGAELRYLRQENRGPAAARNAGLAVARGDVIGFLDADDLWPAHKVARQLEVLIEDPAADVVHGRTQALVLVAVAADGARRFEPFAEPWYATQLGSALYRREIYARVGGFDPALEPSEDFDWFLRAREGGAKVVRTPETALLYRFHTSNLTRGAGSLNLLTTIKRSLDRRRGRAEPVREPSSTSARGGDHF
jgi:glycosyltransferase involved in cell wall biosynthesis